MQVYGSGMPYFRASNIPRVEPPLIMRRRLEMQSERSVKNLDPAGSTNGANWIQSYMIDIEEEQLSVDVYRGAPIDYNNNPIIQKRKQEYQAAKFADDSPGEQVIKKDNLNRLRDIRAKIIAKYK